MTGGAEVTVLCFMAFRVTLQVLWPHDPFWSRTRLFQEPCVVLYGTAECRQSLSQPARIRVQESQAGAPGHPHHDQFIARFGEPRSTFLISSAAALIKVRVLGRGDRRELNIPRALDPRVTFYRKLPYLVRTNIMCRLPTYISATILLRACVFSRTRPRKLHHAGSWCVHVHMHPLAIPVSDPSNCTPDCTAGHINLVAFEMDLTHDV